MELMRFAGVSAGFVVGVSAASGQVFVDDRAGWVAASPAGVVTPDYANISAQVFEIGNTDFLGADGNPLFTVTVSTNGGAFDADSDADYNDVNNFIFDFDPVTEVVFTFAQPIVGFAAEWSNTFVQDGFSATTPNATYDLNAIGDGAGGLSSLFIGVQEAAGFSTITFSTTDPNPGNDFVFFSNFEWAPVPAPGSAALLGVAGVAAVRRRR